MQGMKYIVYDDHYRGFLPYIFALAVQHSDFASQMGFQKERIRSAGMVTIGSNGPRCFGNSLTLGVSVDPDDQDLILRHLEP